MDMVKLIFKLLKNGKYQIKIILLFFQNNHLLLYKVDVLKFIHLI